MIKYFLGGFLRLDLCYALAIADIKQFFHRAVLGILWVTLSFFLFIIVKNFIFSSFVTVPEEVFVMWVALGYAIWVFISTSVVEGSILFVRARPWILSLRIPCSVFVMQSLIKLSIFMLFNLVACFIIALVFKFQLQAHALYALPGFLALFINHILLQTTIGYFAAKHRDIIHFLQAAMRIMFFLTPILYMPGQIGKKAAFLQYNPFTHFLAIIRDPIIFGTIPVLSWIVVGGITLVSLCVSMLVVKYSMKNLSLWV